MTLLGRALERAVYDVDLWGPAGKWRRGEDVHGAVSLSGAKVSRESALQLSAVWACVSLICDIISTLPLDVFLKTGENRREPLSVPPAWLERPNPAQDWQQFVSQQLLAMLLDGTAYVYTIRDGVGDVSQCWNIPPWKVTPNRTRTGAVTYSVVDPSMDMNSVTLDQGDMFHIPALSWPNELKGINPVEAMKRVFGVGMGAQEFAERFYGQGMNHSGIIQAPMELTPDQATQLKADFMRAGGGMKNSHLPVVLQDGAEWKPMMIQPDQAQFLESRQFTVQEIARLFRVPPHMIADVENSTSWGTGIEQQGIGFVQYTLLPWLTRLERAYRRNFLFFQPRAYVKFNVDGLERGDLQTRGVYYSQARNGGWMSANDVRALEDLPPLSEGGDEYWRPAAMTLAGAPIPEKQESTPPTTPPQAEDAPKEPLA